ncbi:kinase-like protein [Aspergillus pseudotamarii]|uniref:non-specific serine/threonine protein kinase n=1 Tax=Aspergillus pseudotamarii TaxID=132259 RepID=A0A5N6SP48_ASPPS|nr:kinase-like protein [Aspergillus pseudotamarii]KAE8134924.1 kinase-like protein [Aspergillus pseudotamarii]
MGTAMFHVAAILVYRRRKIATVPISQPRVFPDSGFHCLDLTARFEEETLPDYSEERYYPIHIGEIFKSQYQVVTKLGYGSSSTVWLCRDLCNRRYLVLKVHVRTKRQPPEVGISNHLKAMQSTHTGKKYVRLILDAFEIPGPYGVHPCLLYEPAGIDIRDYIHGLEGDALPENVLRPTLRFVLIALDYLHQANIIHTDIQPNNILLGIDDDSILAEMEEDEISNPCPRKQLPDRTIYATRAMPLTSGEPILADLGEARLAEGKQTGLIMPGVYRAPEVSLGMDWDSKVDIWGLGQMAWTLFEQGHLFRTLSLETEAEKAQRIAEMISLLGPPPAEFLRRSQESLKFWDENGNWNSPVKIPEQSLEGRESRLETDNQVLFLRFLRKTLRWLPEERPTAKELLLDEWLRGDDY